MENGSNRSYPGCDQAMTSGVRQQLLLAQGATAALSLAACVIAMLLVCLCRVCRRFTHRISFYLLFSASLTELAFCLQTALYNYDPSSTTYVTVCKILGFLLEYTIWFMLLFMSVLMFHLACLTILIEIRATILVGVTYRVLISTLSDPAETTRTKARRQALCLETWYVLVPALVPLVFIWIPFMHDAYGLAGAWCWIRQRDDNCSQLTAGLVEQYTLWYGPLFVLCFVDAVIISAILVILCKKACSRETPDQIYMSTLKENAPLMIYPIFYQILNCVAVAQRIHESVTSQTSYALWMMHATIPPLWGLIFATAYILYLIIWKLSNRATNSPSERSPLLRSEIEIIEST